MCDAGRFLHLSNEIVLRTALRGEGQKSNSRLFDTAQNTCSLSSRYSDLSGLLRCRTRINDAVGIDQKSVFTEVFIRAFHQEAARYDGHSRLCLDDLKCRTEHVACGVYRTRDEAVCIAELDHHDSEVHRIRNQFLRIFLGDPLCFSQLEKRLCVVVKSLTLRRIDDRDTFDIRALLGCRFRNSFGRSDQDRLCKAFLLNDLRRLYGALLVAFGKNDLLYVCLCFCTDLLN